MTEAPTIGAFVHAETGQPPHCPYCIERVCIPPGIAVPLPGAFVVCMGCEGLAVVTPENDLRRPDDGELSRVDWNYYKAACDIARRQSVIFAGVNNGD